MKTSKVFLLIIALLAACQMPKEEPINPLLDAKTMAKFLTELHFYESMVNNRYIQSDQSAHYYQQLFIKHQVTPQQLDSALVWYEHHHKEYLAMYALVRHNFEVEVKKINSGIYNYYLPELPSIWTYYGKAPATDTCWHSFSDFTYYLQLPAPELRTDHCSSHPYVERLGRTTPYWKVGD